MLRRHRIRQQTASSSVWRTTQQLQPQLLSATTAAGTSTIPDVLSRCIMPHFCCDFSQSTSSVSFTDYLVLRGRVKVQVRNRGIENLSVVIAWPIGRGLR